VITNSESFPIFAPLLGTLPYLRHLAVTGQPRAGAHSWDEWLRGKQPDLPAVQVSPDDDAFSRWVMSTPGRIRLVSYQHGDWTCCCDNLTAQFHPELTMHDTVLSASRLSSIFGLGNALMLPMHLGASTVLSSGNWQAREVLKQVRSSHASVLFAIPSMYAEILREARSYDYDLSSLRFAVSAGAPLQESVRAGWHSMFGIEILDSVRDFATQKRPAWQHWRMGARILYGQQVLSWV
jgi:acyl-CoA synthetase (AMP-forming)/AMP-acid ligase II